MSALAIALDIISRGYAPVPVPVGKNPNLPNWPRLRITAETAPRYFNGARINAGAIMGPASNGLTDVDLDCMEAVKLAPYFLPRTSSIYGRASKRRSHYLYKCEDPEPKATIKLSDERKICIVELRMGGGGKGAQSVWPGSTHPSGEQYEWDEDGIPAAASCAELRTAITKIAAAAILMRAWPAGSRHDAALALGGFLARAGWQGEDIANFIETIAEKAGDEEVLDRRRAAEDAVERHSRGENVYGLPGLCEYFGEDAAEKVAKLLAYRELPRQPDAIDASGRPIATPNWREVTARGYPVASLQNARLMIEAMGVECRYDAFHDKILIGWRGDAVRHEVLQLAGEITNNALKQLRQLASNCFGFDPKDEHIRDAAVTMALEHRFDPILDMLDAAQAGWDGVARLDAWVVNYLKCVDTKLNRAIGRKVLIAAVRRARKPGAKFDNITVLESPEGWNKSTAINIIAGDENFSDQSLLGARDREVQEQLAGIWMHENADLAGMAKTEVERVKAFASRTTDRARPAYGHVREDRKRRSIEWGTTNTSEYLRSQTGNRRFWPLAVTGAIDIEALRRDRLQLLGEAATREAAGESLVLDDELWGAAAEAQEARRTADPWEDLLANMPEIVNDQDRGGFEVRIIHLDLTTTREIVGSADVLTHVLKVPPATQNEQHGIRLANAMRKNGWQRHDHRKVMIGGKSIRGYWRERN